jgi:alpha-L-arabinofuranosidase
MPKRHSITIRLDMEIGIIQPEVHGQFAEHLGTCVYGGLWVGKDSRIPNIEGYRKDAVGHLRALEIPVLRWPGGCFADDYHWRDGIGPPGERPKRVNLWWDHVIEDNSFGTHEFMTLCGLLRTQPYIAGNLGSGSPEELRGWVEYCNQPAGSTLAEERKRNGSREPFAVRYWGIGNESWACGGHMTPEEYASLYSRYVTYVHSYGGTEPFCVACGPSNNDTEWTRRFLHAMNRTYRVRVDGFAMHFYSWGKSTPTGYTIDAMREQLSSFVEMENGIVEQRGLLDAVQADPHAGRVRLLVDEWGTWDKSDSETEERYGRYWQTGTMRDALAAGLGLNVFHRQADKLAMCNIAQVANVLQSMLLTHEDHCIRTPSYHAFMLCKGHRSKMAVPVESDQADVPLLSFSASRDERSLVLTAVNISHDTSAIVDCSLEGEPAKEGSGEMLHHRDFNAGNTFDAPDTIVPEPLSVTVNGNDCSFELPPLSVATVVIGFA